MFFHVFFGHRLCLLRPPALLRLFVTVSPETAAIGARRLIDDEDCRLDELGDECLYQEVTRFLLFSRLLPIAVAALAVSPTGPARRAVVVALPGSGSTLLLSSLLSVATLSFGVRRLGRRLTFLLVCVLGDARLLGSGEGEEAGIVLLTLLIVLVG